MSHQPKTQIRLEDIELADLLAEALRERRVWVRWGVAMAILTVAALVGIVGQTLSAS
jgi:hypothetical protein